MPIEATPLEQVVVVALATYEIGEVTVEPLLGLVTVTVAKAGSALSSKAHREDWIVRMA
jgi:hypothetical protein